MSIPSSLIFPKVFPITCHTDYVGVGTCFVAIKGQNFDGMLYIPQAIAKGATSIVVQQDVEVSKDILDLIHIHGVSLIKVSNVRKSLGELSAKAAGFPAKKLKILGVTGTKGKTTSVYMLESLLKKLGKKVARLSTISNSINEIEFPSPLTTAQPDYLHQFLNLCVKEGVEYVVMEVTAQAVTFSRLETISFDGLIFTNLEREHAELYPTMEEYFEAKCKIIKNHLKSDKICIVNLDNQYGEKVLEIYPIKTKGFSFFESPYQDSIKIEYHNQKVRFLGSRIDFSLLVQGLVGDFNVRNFAGVILLLIEQNIDVIELEKLNIEMPKIPGRLEEYILSNGAKAYIDYAHTPGSFENVLSVMRKLTDDLIIVFGAGGNKDPLKRPLMGKIAASFGDLIILTNDNPRTEDPEKIMTDLQSDIFEFKHKVIVEFDRKKAIEIAFKYSKQNSIIMLLGKGPDEYQIFGKEKIFFSEKLILQSL